MKYPKLPEAATSIEKGIPLKFLLDKPAIECLAKNLKIVYNPFPSDEFIKTCMDGLEFLTLKQRGDHIAVAMKKHLPDNYTEGIEIILASLTPPLEKTHDNGLASMFYMPHCSYIAQFGLNPDYNNGLDPFEISMNAQYEITQRFTAEFSIRTFIIDQQERTFKVLHKWLNDTNPHVRRLCSEGTRPRLPWAQKLQSLIDDPTPSLPILEQLKNDPELYVRRSVANHIGDIAKDNLDLALEICKNWLKDSSTELKWVIRHALRYPSKKGNKHALEIRKLAK